MISDEIVTCSMRTALAKLVFSSMKHNSTDATELVALNATGRNAIP